MFKLKNFKLFESESKFAKVKSEIESVSYIMEDEKMKIDIQYGHDFGNISKVQECLTVRVDHLNPLMGHGDYSWLRKYDWFLEWLDRVKEISSSNGFQVRESYNVFIIS